LYGLISNTQAVVRSHFKHSGSCMVSFQTLRQLYGLISHTQEAVWSHFKHSGSCTVSFQHSGSCTVSFQHSGSCTVSFQTLRQLYGLISNTQPVARSHFTDAARVRLINCEDRKGNFFLDVPWCLSTDTV
jgi:hypothetical protein